jgi:hypothetical protein
MERFSIGPLNMAGIEKHQKMPFTRKIEKQKEAQYENH